MNPGLEAVPGLGGLPEWAVALVLTGLWAANAGLAAWAAGRGRFAALAAVEAVLGAAATAAWGWRTDSAVLWLWGNAVTALLLGGGLTLALRSRLGPATGDRPRLSTAVFWRVGWPLVPLVLAANLLVGGLRHVLSGVLR